MLNHEMEKKMLKKIITFISVYLFRSTKYGKTIKSNFQ